MLTGLIRDVPDFPVPGILFRDISPLLESSDALQMAGREMVRPFDMMTIDAFVGVESRGFILAASLAGQFKKGFIPLRKAGKLPPPVLSESYALEYGEATLEIAASEAARREAGASARSGENTPAKRVVIIDDVLATGGTLSAAIRLTEDAGYDVRGCAVLIDLRSLNKLRFRGEHIHSVIQY